MTELVVIVPVLDRPGHAQPLADSLAQAASLSVRLLFVCSPGDDAEIAACHQTGADVVIVAWPPSPGDWARKINYAYTITDEPMMLLAADDVRFHPGFDVALAAKAEEGYGVVGCRDLGNSEVDAGRHACHPLVTRGYADACGTIDACEKIVHDGYAHNWVDVELVETAKQRGAWAFCFDAVIEHRHPFWRKAVDDATYQRGREGYDADYRLYQSRRHLWEGALVA